MNFKAIIIRLYFMLIYSDGKVNQGEISLGKKMIETEGISEAEFNAQIESLKKKDSSVVYKECVADLKHLKPELQIRCIAWMCVLANSDGFMDKAEWQFIYKIYHKELHLPLDNIMEVQKELSKLTRDNSAFLTSTLPVNRAS
ncbi:MAG TPA: TerB family tellurite resistance protein [Chryseolinea sp.]|nr:TerB family tellurite resistance protein [Chryseolinea sp.]